MVRTPSRRSAPRIAAVVLALAAVLIWAPGADAEQATSKQRRVQSALLDAGDGHICAVLASRRLRCWGSGDYGQVGYGNVDNVGDNELPGSVSPVNVGNGRRVLAIAGGSFHTCAILDNGKVRCWGEAESGRLGRGNTNDIGDDETPGSVSVVKLGTGRRAVAITAGYAHTCVILDNGKVRCWGRASSGQLGYGNQSNIGDNETPASVAPVQLGRKAVAIAAGSFHTCAILDNGRLRCWGDGFSGQLGYGNQTRIGDNETPASVAPVNLGPGRKAVAVGGGYVHTCVLLDNGKVRCFGAGSDGRLGYGNTSNVGDNETPASVAAVKLRRKAVAIAVGYSHTCALLNNGRVRCWGSGSLGALGYGNLNAVGDTETPDSVGPVELGAGRKALAVTVGAAISCALLDTGRVRCWGFSGQGQSGHGSTATIGDNETPGSVAPASLGGLISTRKKPKLGLAVKPVRDASWPYQFVASGKLSGFLADPATCREKVVVRAKLGGTTVVRRPKLRVGATACTYSTVLPVGFGGSWRVTASFAGNGSLKARTSRARTARAG